MILFFSFRFALGGAESRVLKTEFNPSLINHIMGYIFGSLRSLDWIEVGILSPDSLKIPNTWTGCGSNGNSKIGMGR